MANIVSLGSALQDIFLIDHDDLRPGPYEGDSIFKDLKVGTKVDIDRISYEVGGGGTNSAVAFARHGHRATFLGNLGHDPAGDAVLNCLAEEGVDSAYASFAPRRHTGCSVILVDLKSGERTILTFRGASARFDNLEPKVLRELKPDWLYVTSLRGEMAVLKNFFKEAKVINHAKIMFNPGVLELERSRELVKLFKYVDILLVNKREAKQIVPGEILEELLSRLANYVKTVIITDGGRGGIATDHRQTFRFGLYEDVKVRDTTGAGDAFGSGFLAHLTAGKSFKRSLVFASANSTSVVAQLGAKRGLLSAVADLHQMPIQELRGFVAGL